MPEPASGRVLTRRHASGGVPLHQQQQLVLDLAGPDFYNVAALLSDEERQVQATVARFVDERVLPIIADCFEHERFPSELVPEMAELGLFGPTFQDYGCAGLNNVAYG